MSAWARAWVYGGSSAADQAAVGCCAEHTKKTGARSRKRCDAVVASVVTLDEVREEFREIGAAEL